MVKNGEQGEFVYYNIEREKKVREKISISWKIPLKGVARWTVLAGKTRGRKRMGSLYTPRSYLAVNTSIVGMLTNLDSLPIERIHQMLKIFAMQVSTINFFRERNCSAKKIR